MKTIKTTQQLTLIKVGASGNDNVYLNVDTNGALEISTTTGSDGGLTVKGATSEVNLEGNLTVTGTTAIPTLGSDLDVNGFDIISSFNGDIELNPDGTGKILLTGTTKMGGDIDVNGNLITTTVSNGNVGITPNGTGEINLNGPVNLGGDLDIGSYNIISTAGADIELDPDAGGKILLSATTQLGGNLDVVSHNIISSSNNDIEIDPDGTGQILLTAVTKLGGNLDVNGNSITTTVTNGDVTITPNGTGNVVLDGIDWPNALGTANYILKTDGVGSSSWGQATFLELSDSPNSYTTYGDRLVKVNAGATAVDFSNYTETDISNTVNNVFEGEQIVMGDSDYTLTSQQAKKGKLLILGSKTSNTYYVKTASIQAAGTGYTAGDILTIVGGTSSTVAKIKVDSVGGGGDITSILVETDIDGDEGNYSVIPANPVSVTGGTGTTATFNLTWDYRGVVLGVDAADGPIDLLVYQLYEDGDLIIKSTDQVYRAGIPISLLQLRRFILNSTLLGTTNILEFNSDSPSVNDRKVVDLITDDDYELNFYTSKCHHLSFTDSGTVLTAARDINVPIGPYDPAQPGLQIIKNETAQSLVFKSGATGVTLEPSKSRVIYYDGTDHKKIPIYVQDDTAPKLSGDLDVNGNDITTNVTNGDVVITPNGSGNIVLDGVDWPNSAGTADYVLKTNGTNAASWTLLNLDYLDDVVISSASDGDFIIHNGTNWIDSTYSKFYEMTTTTTDATPTVVKSIAISSNTAATFIINGHAFEAATGDTYAVHLFGCIKNYSGTTSIVGSVDNTHIHNPGGTTWTITAVANNTSDTLDVTVTGENAKTLSWKVKVDLIRG